MTPSPPDSQGTRTRRTPGARATHSAWVSLALGLALPATSYATTIGVGALAAPRPALSVQVSPEAMPCTYHITAHVEGEGVSADADCQRMQRLHALATRSLTPSAYAGAGIRGEAARADGAEEHYHLRLPLGIQVDIRPLHLSAFAEAAFLLGPLPMTASDHALALGLRALF